MKQKDEHVLRLDRYFHTIDVGEVVRVAMGIEEDEFSKHTREASRAWSWIRRKFLDEAERAKRKSPTKRTNARRLRTKRRV